MTRTPWMIIYIFIGLLIFGVSTVPWVKAKERSTLIVIMKCGAPLAYTGVYRTEEGSRLFFIAQSKIIETEWSNRLKLIISSNPVVSVFSVQDESGEKCPLNI